MRYDPERHHRHSLRLPGYNYAQAGLYFVTVVAQGRIPIFGEIRVGEMLPNACGHEVLSLWEYLPEHFAQVQQIAFILMPNHAHFIIGIGHEANTSGTARPTLGQIVAFFKHETTKYINALRHTPDERVWQRNYYEHIIRNETELERLQRYIVENPVRWDTDAENTE